MTAPKFKAGDVVTWRWSTQDDGILYSGTVKHAEQLPDGRWMYWTHLSFNKVLESDIITLLHRLTPEPVRDPVRDAGFPWRHEVFDQIVDMNNECAAYASRDRAKADRIVALSRLPGVLHEIAGRADEPYTDETATLATICDIASRALESVGVKL